MRARWIHSTSALLLCLVAPAFAQPDDEAKAKEHFKAAQAAYNLGQFDQALEGYSQAYAAKPLAPFLFNIAQCHRQLGQWERAAFFYKRFLAMGAPGAEREKVEQLAQQMEQKQAEADARRVAEAEAAQRAAMHAHTLELERARAATAKAEADAAAQRAAEAAAAAKRLEENPPPAPLYQRWWVWAGAGAVVAVGVVATSVAIVNRPQPEVPSYGTVNAR